MSRALALCIVVAFTAASCGGRSPAPLHLSVSPRDALGDAPVSIVVTGARRSARLEVTATTVDAFGARWKARADYVAGSSGRVDLRSARSHGGTYRGVAPMGLFWSLRKLGSREPPGRTDLFAPFTEHVTITASSGGRTAQAEVARNWVLRGVVSRRASPARDGFVGCYFAPRASAGRIPGVVILGGSEGGLNCSGTVLAAHGLAVLQVAYFAAPTLPHLLERIPVEYFCGALRWLARQPGVDPNRLAVWGISYGAEAAILSGIHCPLAHAVIEAVGRDIADAGCCTGQSAGEPAWTVGGKGIPPGTPLQVWRVHGPMLLIGGEQDALFNSGVMADQMGRALRAHGRRGDIVLTYARAGHALGFLTPYLPIGDTIFQFGIPQPLGGTLAGDARARADAWPKVVSFLKSLPAG